MTMEHWNTLIRIRDSKECNSDEIKEMATMLLNQLNTAAGSIIKPEIESFIYTNNLEKYTKFNSNTEYIPNYGTVKY